MNILVAGAGGELGREIVAALNRRGIVPDGLVYSEREFERVEYPLARKLCCDVTKPHQLEAICKTVDIVISTIGITRLQAEITHMDVDYQGNLNLLEAAKKENVRKFVFISPAGTDQGYKRVPLYAAKYLFEERLRECGLSWLIFHSGGFYKDLADYGKSEAYGRSCVINGGMNRFTPIAISELAEIMVEDTLKEDNKIIEVGGPDDLSWTDVCRICSEALEKRARFVNVPAWFCRFVLLVIKPFSHKYHSMGQLLLYASTHDLLSPKRGKLRFIDYVRQYYTAVITVDGRSGD
ncbi:MAG: NAD(P)H-binding protein [Syntrophaceae bacterium]|nr:NAD(P)H-binding protein [Syntrophaceae bacterium]